MRRRSRSRSYSSDYSVGSDDKRASRRDKRLPSSRRIIGQRKSNFAGFSDAPPPGGEVPLKTASHY